MSKSNHCIAPKSVTTKAQKKAHSVDERSERSVAKAVRARLEPANLVRMYSFKNADGHYSIPFYGLNDEKALEAWKECVKLYGIANVGEIYWCGWFNYENGKFISQPPKVVKE